MISSAKLTSNFCRRSSNMSNFRPKQGKRMLVELVNLNQMDQAVAYLHAMNARAASKILKEFKTDPEIALATKLLERLRTFGKEGDAARMTASASNTNGSQVPLDANRPSSTNAAR